MDYKAFYGDVLGWIQAANQAAARYGMSNPDFWQWVADSCGEISRKYQENRLVIKQMVMLVEWLEETYENSKQTKG